MYWGDKTLFFFTLSVLKWLLQNTILQTCPGYLVLLNLYSGIIYFRRLESNE